MGARTTKLENKNEKGSQLSSSTKKRFKSRGFKITKKRRSQPSKERDHLNSQSNEEPKTKKLSLHELHLNPPPGFRKFESEVDWRDIDEDIAFQLWEDIFKPLYTFYEVRRIQDHLDG